MEKESHMVNFKKILVLLQLFVRFLTPITLRAETNIGVNQNKLHHHLRKDRMFLVSLQRQLMRKQEMFCMIKRISPSISC